MNKTVDRNKIEWIKNLPDSWDIIPLKYATININEKNNPVKMTNILSLTNKDGVIPYEQKGNQGNISKEDLSQYKLAYKDTIIINSMNLKIGSVGLSNYDGCVSPVYYVLKNTEKSDIRYINYIFQSNFQKYLGKYGKGIMEIREKIPMYDVMHTYIPFPEIKIQKKIANYLDDKCKKINEVIESNKKEIELIEDYKESMISQSLKTGIRNNKIKDSSIYYLGNISENWKITKIGRIFEIKKRIIGKEGVDVLSITQNGIKIKDISSNEGQLAADYSKYQIVKINDFAMNHMDLLTGWIDCSKYEGVTSPDYRVFNFKDGSKYDRRYYLYLFQLFYKEKIFYGLAQGVSDFGRMRLQKEQFLNMSIPVPELDEQNEIADYIDNKCKKLNQVIEYRKNIIEKLEEYKKSLIYDVVIGKKEI